VLPPYNSIQAQVVKTERMGEKPVLLGSDPEDHEVLVDGAKRFKLAYTHEDPEGVPNKYSAKKKLVYWGVKHRDGQLPGTYFSNLYFYKDLEGSNPENTTADEKKLHVGIDTRIALNEGPTGQHVGRGFLRYTGASGTQVFTDSPAMENVPIRLTNPGIWEALGLPLTPFNVPIRLTNPGMWEALGLPLTPFNDNFTQLITLDETMVQPFMRSVVTMVDAENGTPVIDSSGQPVRFFGVNPIDIPNCSRCHANQRANGTKYLKYKEEYNFWKAIRGSGAGQWDKISEVQGRIQFLESDPRLGRVVRRAQGGCYLHAGNPRRPAWHRLPGGLARRVQYHGAAWKGIGRLPGLPCG